jgi:cytochrome c
MTFAGISNAEKRADLIAYINAQGSNLPLPAGAPAAAEGAEAADAAAGGNEAAAANAAAPADNAAAPAAK